MAVTRDGVPVRCWTFAGNEGDQAIIRTVKDDLGAWNLRRMVWVADRGFASAANRAYLTRGGGHYIHAEKLRHTNTEAAAARLGRSLPHRRRQPAYQGSRRRENDKPIWPHCAAQAALRLQVGPLQTGTLTVAPGGHGDGDDGARAVREPTINTGASEHCQGPVGTAQGRS